MGDGRVRLTGRVLMVGLTGGIGAGKSAVATRLAGHGAIVIDADRLAREVVEPGTDGLRDIVAGFGAQVLDANGALDRSALGALVFHDDGARVRLEAIVHPRVRARTADIAAAAPADAVVVNDVPLLVETGLAATYHLVIVVTTARDIRVARLVRDRGMSPAEAEARIRAQAGDDQRRAAADVPLDNDGTPADLAGAVDDLWHDRLRPFERNLRARRPAPRPARVTLVDADPTWPQQFVRLAARIDRTVAGVSGRTSPGAAGRRVDHIGSTAVPGLVATDVIDIQLTVGSLAEADELAEPLARAGFPRCPGPWRDSPKPGYDSPVGAGVAADIWDKRLHGNADPGRPVNLHLRVAGTPGWRYALLMRDHLRSDPEERAGYLAVKRRLAADLPIEQHTAGKERWFEGACARADQWARSTGWQP